MEKTIIVMIIALVTLLYPDVSFANPRSQLVRQMYTDLFMHNRSIYVPNFISTMENISSQLRNTAFGIASTGVGPDACYGLAQCYGDLSLVDCMLCYAEARTYMPRYYPMSGGTVFLDGCFMRADNYSFYHEYMGPNDQAICGNTTRGNSVFWQSARQALSRAILAAPNNNGFARGHVAVSRTANASAYVLANCWRTLDASSCRACLENASARIFRCLPWSEGRVINTGCFVRYSDTNFLNPVPANGISRGTIIVIVVAVVSAVSVFIIGAAIGVYIWKRRIIEKKRQGNAQKLVKTLNDSSLNFKYSTLEKATGSFDEANKLGQGGFGTVYKGVLPDGREIAVKRLFFNNKHRAADFYNEVNIISSVEHRNLVRLLGCSCSGPESLLVYEYLPNLSLDRFIFDPSKGKSLNWQRRFEIIIGTTEGIVYLHENNRRKIIHRDIKASNILLDSRLRAKIADFGLARSFQDDKSHISTAIAGTLGYMAPEYLAHGKLTEKADVYSYGVLLLEIVSGRENNQSKTTEYGDSLVTLAWTHFQEKTIEELVDPNLMLQHDYENTKTEIRRVIHVGLLCCQEIPSLRPMMSSALQMLVKKEECLPSPTNPPFMDDKTMELHKMTGSEWTPLQPGSIDSAASMSHSMFYPR